MINKPLPFHKDQIIAAAERFPTPFHLYHAGQIQAAATSLHQAFGWADGFTNYFAVKATPTPRILSLLTDQGCGLDCSSMAELILAERIGVAGKRIMFSSNNTPAEEFRKAAALGALINLDTSELLDDLIQTIGVPQTISFRYNPGPLREGNAIIGRPEEAKFGCTREQLIAGYQAAHERGVQVFGLHTMLASNELDPAYFIATAEMLFVIAAELYVNHHIRISFINLGGGIGIPYQPEQQAVDLKHVSAEIAAAYRAIIEPAGLAPLQLMMECGRMITGPAGVLVTRVRHTKQSYKYYIGVDGSMADLMRPGIYGAYHHISVIGNNSTELQQYDVVGSLCENNDKFAIDRMLPAVKPGDLLVIHDTGAHGRAMGFNYNGKLRSAEILLHEHGEFELIRRAETIEDLFATLVL